MIGALTTLTLVVEANIRNFVSALYVLMGACVTIFFLRKGQHWWSQLARKMFMKVRVILMAVLGRLRCPFDTDGLAVSQFPCCRVSN